jgi:hypothetical protein
MIPILVQREEVIVASASTATDSVDIILRNSPPIWHMNISVMHP